MTVWEYSLLRGCAENTENQANSSGCWHNSWDFCTPRLKCSTCLEGICLHERRSKPSTSPTRIHCSRSYSYTAYHCKSSDYSTEWLLTIHPSDSFLAPRVMGIYRRILLTSIPGKKTANIQTTAHLSGASSKFTFWLYYVRCVSFLIAVEI